jgi:delta8-fatty-acid desaturase
MYDIGMTAKSSPTSNAKLWTRQQVASHILKGETLVVFNNQLLRIPPSWLNAHPGGSLAILHFVGRDATDEISAYHSEDTLQRFKSYAVGTVETGEDGWDPLVPPVMSGWVRKPGKDGTYEWFNEAGAIRSAEDSHTSPSQILLVQRDSPLISSALPAPSLSTLIPPPTNLSLKVQSQYSAAYKILHKKITDAGLYKTPYITGYGPELFRYILLGSLSAYAYACNWLITSSVFLGFMWHQLVFTAHDLGHMGVTHHWAVDRILGILIADFIGGLSIGWWVDVSSYTSHRVTSEFILCFRIIMFITVCRFRICIEFFVRLMRPAVVTNHPSQYVSSPLFFVFLTLLIVILTLNTSLSSPSHQSSSPPSILPTTNAP